MDFVIANQEKVNAMIKTTLKIDGMMCGMCESHMNDLIRKNFQVKKVTSSAKDGETVIISDNEIDIPWAICGSSVHGQVFRSGILPSTGN